MYQIGNFTIEHELTFGYNQGTQERLRLLIFLIIETIIKRFH